MSHPSELGLGLLCIHAHPDDESISTGGVLARYADEGIRTAVVTCTGGERGEVVGPGMDPDDIGSRLGQVREAELSRALGILAAGPPRFLGYVDSGMMGTDGNDDEASFWRASFDDAVGRMVAQIRALRPDVAVTYEPFGGYGHPDHIQSHRVACAAIEAADVAALYPQAGPAWRVRKVYFQAIPKSRITWINSELARRGLPSPFGVIDRAEELPFGIADERITTVVDVGAWYERKVAAIRAHASQLGPDSFFLNFPDELLSEAFSQEWFIRHRSDVDVPEVEDDLFAGLRGV
ncbi:MAG: N-acetyl-1-D-myo-inositol-2-amino-2-deoxy-alpha-D-glucopyranoside deacetylase [Egibacteraceae bacterium]